MKICYIVNTPFVPSSGVSSKIIDQVYSWRNSGHQVYLFWLSETYDDTVGIKFFDKAKGWRSSRALWHAVLDSKCDVVYLRFELFKPWMLSVLKKFPVIVEVNGRIALQYWRAACHLVSPRLLLQLFYFLLTKRLFFGKVAGIVSVTTELFHLNALGSFQCPKAAIPNAIQLDRITSDTAFPPAASTNPVVAGCFSSNGPYEGVADFIEFARKCVGELDFVLMAPDVSPMDLPSNVDYKGIVPELECQKILQSADVGIGPIGCHRGGFTMASPLKVRLFLACGLPVILPYTDEMFTKESTVPDWALQFPSSDGSLITNKAEIVEFCQRWQGLKVARDAVRPFIDSNVIESRRLAVMQSVVL